MSINHAERAHATWSASASARLWACPGSMKLASTVETPRRSNPAAEWGSTCHELSELCLRDGSDPHDHIGRTMTAKIDAITIDEEMAECAAEYVDYVRTANRAAEWLKIEQRFSLESLKPPFDAGGTADAVLFYPELKMLEVVDLKGGRGVVVEAKGNPQLRTYALGAMLANQGLDVTWIQVTIVQPRAPHKDGRIRSERFHVADLVEWTADLMVAMRRAVQAAGQYEAAVASGSEAAMRSFVKNDLCAGDHCKFCPAAATCPALSAKAMEKAHAFFNDETKTIEVPRPNTVDKLMPEDIASILDAADLIQDWLNAVRAYAHEQAEMGVVIPGYQLVDKRANRKWAADEATVRQELFVRADLTDVFGPPKLLSVAQIEKRLGAERAKKVLAGLWAQESSGTNLVASNKTTRSPAKPAVERHFSPIGD
jgi:hypothetical protein